MRFIMKIIGGWFLLLGAVAFVADFTTASVSDGAFASTAIADHWQALHKVSYAATERWAAETVPLLWTWVMSPALQCPTWALLIAIGAALFWTSRKRKRVEIFAN